MRLATIPGPVRHRYFFALKPDEITARRTHAFAEEQLGSHGLLPAARHHVTLAITGDYAEPEPGVVHALLCAGEQVFAAPFELTLGRLSGGVRSVALRPDHAIPELKALQKDIAAAMAREGLVMRKDWSFSPHQTLGYRDGAPFSRLVQPFRWHVREFVLVHSYAGLSRHEILGRWPLHPEEDPQLTLF